MQQVGQQGVRQQPTPPSKELLDADPLGYISADAEYREQMGAFQAQQQQLTQQSQAMQQAQAQAHKANLQEQMAELQRAIPDFSNADKAPKMKERLVKQGVSEGYTVEEIGGIVDHRAMVVLHKAMLYDQLVAGKGTAEAKLKKARPLMKAGVKKTAPSTQKTQQKLMSKLKKSGSANDAVGLLFS
jgi:type IV secretory pathway VirB10-like protein